MRGGVGLGGQGQGTERGSRGQGTQGDRGQGTQLGVEARVMGLGEGGGRRRR